MNLDIDGDSAAIERVGDAVSHVPANPPRDEGHAGFLGILEVRGERRAARRVGPEGAAIATGPPRSSSTPNSRIVYLLGGPLDDAEEVYYLKRLSRNVIITRIER